MTATASSSARAAATAAAQPVRRPAHAPAPAAPKRPPLRVVQPGERTAGAQRRRARLLVLSAVVVVAVGLFGAVVAHVVLTQNQFKLERLQRQAAEQQARYERLRLQVAELESPARIVAAAQERLGMVPPPTVKYLTPAKAEPPAIGPTTAAASEGTDDTAGTTTAAGASSRAGQGDDEAAMNEWSDVKRQLGSRP